MIKLEKEGFYTQEYALQIGGYSVPLSAIKVAGIIALVAAVFSFGVLQGAQQKANDFAMTAYLCEQLKTPGGDKTCQPIVGDDRTVSWKCGDDTSVVSQRFNQNFLNYSNVVTS